MAVQSTVHSHIDITDTLARLYLFLAQSMDRCVNEEARMNYPEAELQSHLAATKATALDMLVVNQVVKAKVGRMHRISSLVTACLMGDASKAVALEELKRSGPS